MATQPDLGIENPYALDQDQFDAAVDLLKQQNGLLSEYWSDYVAYEDSFRAGSTVLGTSWQIIANTLQADDPPTPVDAVLPEGGLDGVVGQLDDPQRGEAPELRLRVDQLHHLARRAGQVATTFGEAPANLKACETIEGRQAALRATTPMTPRTTTSSGTGRRRPRRASTAARTSSARTTPSGSRPGPRSRAEPLGARVTEDGRGGDAPAPLARHGTGAHLAAPRLGSASRWRGRCSGWSSPTSARSSRCS